MYRLFSSPGLPISDSIQQPGFPLRRRVVRSSTVVCCNVGALERWPKAESFRSLEHVLVRQILANCFGILQMFDSLGFQKWG